MDWHQSESYTIPAEVDLNSSPTTVYFRKNIREEQREMYGEKYTVYVYEEATMPKSEYASHKAYTNQANIDFIAMMSDIELED